MSRRGRGLTPLMGAMLLIAASSAAAADRKAPEHLFGPEPSWEKYRAIAEADIQARLIDPESARITWTTGFYKGEFKPLLQPRVQGYVACGYVNAKNRMGGYTGTTSFVTVIDYDRVLYAEIDRSPAGMVAGMCNKAVQGGYLPPLPAGAAPGAAATGSSATSTAAATLTSATSGLTLRTMPDGAYVSAVAAGSTAAAAGLSPGMVIAGVNGIPLAGMGEAMLKVVDAAGSSASLAIIGGKTIRLGGRP